MFKRFLQYHRKDSLIRDSFLLFTATMGANVLGYFYHFYMGRVLGPASYGILGFFFALLYWVNIPALTLQNAVTKIVSHYKAHQQEKDLFSFYEQSVPQLFFITFFPLLFFFILIPFIAKPFQIPLTSLFLFLPLLFMAFVLPFNRGILQGLQRFKEFGINTIFEGIIKLVSGIGLVYLGFHVGGAVFAITLSFFFAFFHTLYLLQSVFSLPLKTLLSHLFSSFSQSFKKLFHPVQSIARFFTFTSSTVFPSSQKKIDISSPQFYLLSQAWPIFITLVSLTAFYTVDIFLVRYFFSAVESGYYSAISLIGRTIFFGTFSITSVMFPKVAEMASLQKPNRSILHKSLFFMGVGALFAVLFFAFFPQIVVLLLFGKDYLVIVPYVWLFGCVMAIFSFCYLLSFYNLSIHRYKYLNWILLTFNLLEILWIFFSHSSLYLVIRNLLILMICLFIILLWYTFRKPHGT